MLTRRLPRIALPAEEGVANDVTEVIDSFAIMVSAGSLQPIAAHTPGLSQGIATTTNQGSNLHAKPAFGERMEWLSDVHRQ
jgi:hypothetical protein